MTAKFHMFDSLSFGDEIKFDVEHFDQWYSATVWQNVLKVPRQPTRGSTLWPVKTQNLRLKLLETL